MLDATVDYFDEGTIARHICDILHEMPEDDLDLPWIVAQRVAAGLVPHLERARDVEMERVNGLFRLYENKAADAARASDICPFDCDNCHGEDCPCTRGGCAGEAW